MPLWRILSFSAAVSSHLHRRFSMGASHPTWGFMECHITTPIVATHGTTQQCKIIDCSDPDPNIMCFVCNPISSELFGLLDIDGMKRTVACHAISLLTQSARGHGPRDRYAVAALLEDRGEWDKPVGLPSPLPPSWWICLHSHHEVLAFIGWLWWVNMSWGTISVQRPTEAPMCRASEWLRTTSARQHVRGVHGGTGGEWYMYRRMWVSEGRLRYVEVSQKEPFVLNSFALDNDGSGWMLEHRVALG
ncbi:hypothetical protein SETIT_3G210600v2 [Setaria italica]|uniref:DUF1618 domain-containing protein n=1 Tax=Setaria italica TaxID=4555 RepID=K3ZCZ4_SETIT|nr:hypothetical protein SETIT_3G210600v2 [Setaria italica]